MRRGPEIRDSVGDFGTESKIRRDMRLIKKELEDKFDGVEHYVAHLKTDRAELNRVQLAVERYLGDEDPNDEIAKEIQKSILMVETGAN
ncbi:MAG: hypothetical protein JW816_02510 [Candidatus Buchananbacteria bacterium]|nr:hypothetical protein [Candidatus Buchananbacteria bacterium]